jgi:hypothetical protein
VTETTESLIQYCREKGRVCPQPKLWQKLWEMLPNKKQVGASWQPAVPLILAAWDETPALPKMVRLAEHIEWVDKHNVLPAIAAFLRGLREEDWYHVGE